jgi:hypothetical protein
MNPNAAVFYPKLSMQEVYSQTISTVPHIPSVIEDLFFDNLENEFVKNNEWLFQEDDKYFINKVKDAIEDISKEKTFSINSRKGKIIITLQ